MTREEFQTERTRIISEMLDNPDEYGIYPTTKCFEQLDALFDSLSLPPAEGAEEILDKYPHSIEYPSFVHENSAIAAMQEFATLHAQRIADKMVSERLREELMAYDKFLSNTYWGVSHLVKRDEAVDEYLKTRESHE